MSLPSNFFRADLHTHSTCSDGTLTPEELVERAVSLGLSGLAITDHDTIEPYGLALPRAQELGLELIPGAEFSTAVGDEPVHLLAYSFRPDDPGLLDLCARHRDRRTDRNRAILARLKEEGMPVEEEEVAHFAKGTVVGRPHIAQAMVAKGYISSVSAAFASWIGSGERCYVMGAKFEAKEAIDLIHGAGGLAVIAHPGLISKGSVVAALLRMGVDGIEGHYGTLSIQQEKKWIKLAKAHGLLTTGGSDFHGDCKPWIELGVSWTPEEPFRTLVDHFHAV